MPRASSNGRVPIDEERLIDLVKLNPELYRDDEKIANNTISKKLIWRNIADELDAPVDVCKKVWTKIKDNHVRDGLPKDFKNDRRQSLRSGSIEKNRGFLDASSVDNSNDNSRASSNCPSPKNDDRRRLRSSSRSRSHLGAISETDLASMASSSVATITPRDKTPAKSEGQDAGRTPRKLLSLDKEIQDNDNNERYQITQPPRPAERNLRPRFSEPSLLASKEIVQAAANATPRRQSGPNGRNGRMKKSPTASDSTKAFFESMALTVSAFPQHLQAAMKVQICTIIAETEYELSSPKIR